MPNSPTGNAIADASVAADEFKLIGNEHSRATRFHEADHMYKQAIAIQPNDLAYHGNRIAVMLHTGLEDEARLYCNWALAQVDEMTSCCTDGAPPAEVSRLLSHIAHIYAKRLDYYGAIDSV